MPAIKNAIVLTGAAFTEDHKERFEQAAPEGNFVFSRFSKISPDDLAKAQIIFGNPSIEMIAQAKSLEWLQLSSSGADHLFQSPGDIRNDFLLTTATGAFGLSISEYMIGGLLSLMRKLPYYQTNKEQSIWKPNLGVRSIYGSVFLIVGMGDIGNEFARKIKALGGYTIGIRRNKTEKPDYLDELHQMDNIDAILPRVDVLSLSLPSTSETKGLFDKERLSRIKQNAYLINVGRGTVLDQDALCSMLVSGQLAGAVIDVTVPEPLPADNPLWKAPNLVLTPHCCGTYDLPETVERILAICIDNLWRFKKDMPLKNLVDFSLGYRMLSHKE